MSTAAIPVHIGLIDDTKEIAVAELQKLAGALNTQVQADFVPVWRVAATVGVYNSDQPGTWSIHIRKTLDAPGALGYHTDAHNQPIALVKYTSDYSITVSHELLEMLADPWGNRLHSAELPDAVKSSASYFGLHSPRDRVAYLLEVCDPCEAKSYPVGGVQMSDFLLPYWYRSTATIGSGAYSKVSGCTAPREVADGGYVSFMNTATSEWYQIFNERGSLQIQDIGKFDQVDFGSLREFTDHHARIYRMSK